MVRLAPLLVLAACLPMEYPAWDRDGDGHGGADDCDDGDPETYVGAEEICGDGKDNDCSGEADDKDADGDKYIDARCGGGDCDDDARYINPGKDERCNGADDDCSATDCFGDGRGVDEDRDGDGWLDCTAVEGGTEDCTADPECHWDKSLFIGEGDCEDGDPATYPHAPDLCGDGEDNHCDTEDGQPDRDCEPLDDIVILAREAHAWWIGDPEVRGWAGSTLASADIDRDGHLDVIIGSYLAHDHENGRVDVLRGPRWGGFDLESSDYRWTGLVNDLAASSLATGDLDGDGWVEVLVGAPMQINNTGVGSGNAGGRTYLVDPAGDAFADCMGSGPLATRPGKESIETEVARTLLRSTDDEDNAGRALAICDADGDGLAEILVGADQGEDTSGLSNRGVVYVVDGDLLDDGVMILHGEKPGEYHDSVRLVLLGEEARDNLGWAASCGGDVNGDGYADAVVGAPGTGDLAPGKVHLLLGPLESAGQEAGIDSLAGRVWTGEAAGDHAGHAVALSSGAKDLDGDDCADLLLGVPEAGVPEAEDRAGMVYVFYGACTGDLPEDGDLSAADASIGGLEAGDELGWSVAFAGDVDGDDVGDALLGAPGREPNGMAYLVIGGRRLDDEPYSISDVRKAWFQGVEEGSRLGATVAGAGDVNGDEIDDILLGAPAYGDFSGAVYLMYGGASATE